jgi:hypothetical protein
LTERKKCRLLSGLSRVHDRGRLVISWRRLPGAPANRSLFIRHTTSSLLTESRSRTHASQTQLIAGLSYHILDWPVCGLTFVLFSQWPLESKVSTWLPEWMIFMPFC